MIIDQHEVRIYSGAVELELLKTGGRLTADRGWTPHVQGTLSVRPPASDATTSPGEQITIECTQRCGDFAFTRDLTTLYAGGTVAAVTAAYTGGTAATLTALVTAGSWNTPVKASTGRTFTMIITQRTRTRDEHTLQVASIEHYWQRAVHFNRDVNYEGVARTITAGSIRSMVAGTLTSFNNLDDTEPGATFADMSALTYSDSDLIVEVGAGVWDRITDLLSSLQLKLFCRGDTSVLLTEHFPVYPTSIDVVAGDNLLDWEITDPEDGYIMVRWTGEAGNASARPIYTNVEGAAIPIRAYTRLIDVPTPLPTWPPPGRLMTLSDSPADNYANAVGLDESPVRLVTVNDYSVMPGSAITYTLPDEAEETDTIDAITWQLGDRFEMDIWV